MNGLEFNGATYHDDRMFVLYVSKCTVRADREGVSTTIYHEESPENHEWCVVTFRNVERYTATRVDHFDTEAEAIAYRQEVEPTVPLISCGGRSPQSILPYNEFIKWKRENGFKEYDYKKMFSSGGENPRETFYMPR